MLKDCPIDMETLKFVFLVVAFIAVIVSSITLIRSFRYIRKLESISTSMFETSMNAKNQAYYFILSNGLYDEFIKYCRNYNSTDYHKDCVDYLENLNSSL